MVKGYTAEEFFKTMRLLADNPHLRKQVEDEFNTDNPNSKLSIDELGYANISTPLMSTKVVKIPPLEKQ